MTRPPAGGVAGHIGRAGLQRCPLLGLEWDRSTTYIDASAEHVCFGQVRPRSPALPYQSQTCLTAGYVDCFVFGASGPAGAATVSARPAGLAPGVPVLTALFGLCFAAGLLIGILRLV